MRTKEFTCGTKAVKQPMALTMAVGAVSYAGCDFLNQAAHTMTERAKKLKATAEMILVKNHISL
jgi:hypothetical protein